MAQPRIRAHWCNDKQGRQNRLSPCIHLTTSGRDVSALSCLFRRRGKWEACSLVSMSMAGLHVTGVTSLLSTGQFRSAPLDRT